MTDKTEARIALLSKVYAAIEDLDNSEDNGAILDDVRLISDAIQRINWTLRELDEPMDNKRFKQLRVAAVLTQEAAAEYIGVTTKALAHWEQGLRPLPLYAEKAILRAAPAEFKRTNIN